MSTTGITALLAAALWSSKSPFWALPQPTKVAHARWGGVPGIKLGWGRPVLTYIWRFSPTFGVRGVIRAFLGDRRFPGQEEG
eukprot:scaffold18318_cov54-Phaeocystis_antarctica.AAC.2